MNKQHLLPLFAGMLLLSCGKSGSDNAKNGQRPIQEEEQQEIQLPSDGSNIQGKYLAKFKTLNPQVNGTIPGSVTFFRDKDRVMVYLRLFAGHPKAWHQQKIYEGSRCPTISDDTNGDGYIDIFEAEAVLGKQLIPLDADISSQKSGRNFYPLGDLSGSYYYERITSFSRMFRDLKDTKNAGEEYKKLAPEEGLSIAGKAVLIQGVSAEVEFPETVQSSPRYKPFQTLPIACGVFEENNLITGTNDNGEIPGPIADIEEGQDRPAPEGDGEIQREGTGNRGGRTNDAGEGNGPIVDGDGRAPTEPTPRRPDNYGEENGDRDSSTPEPRQPRVNPPRETPPAPEVTPPGPETEPTPTPPSESPAPEVETDSEE
jgi:hypothetical protein